MSNKGNPTVVKAVQANQRYWDKVLPKINSDYTQGITCPYCGFKHDDVSEDYLDQDEQGQFDCSDCQKAFIYTTHYDITFCSEKADCLNGVEHNFVPMIGYPKEVFVGKEKCSMCGEEKTDKKVNDKSVKDYLKSIKQ